MPAFGRVRFIGHDQYATETRGDRVRVVLDSEKARVGLAGDLQFTASNSAPIVTVASGAQSRSPTIRMPPAPGSSTGTNV